MLSPAFQHAQHLNLLGKSFINTLFSFGKYFYNQGRIFLGFSPQTYLDSPRGDRLLWGKKNLRLRGWQIHIWTPARPLSSCVISDRLLNLSEPWVFNLENWAIIPISQHYEVRHRKASGKITGHNADKEVLGPGLAHREPGLTNLQEPALVLGPPAPAPLQLPNQWIHSNFPQGFTGSKRKGRWR